MGRKKDITWVIKRKVIILNDAMPIEVGMYWLTPNEMCERLIHAGVDRLLETSFVDDVIKNLNRGEVHLKSREQYGIRYFRSRLADEKDTENQLPLGQRFKFGGGPQRRISYHPTKDYLKTTHSKDLREMNYALQEWEKQEEEARERKRSECCSSIVLCSDPVLFHVSLVFTMLL